MNQAMQPARRKALGFLGVALFAALVFCVARIWTFSLESGKLSALHSQQALKVFMKVYDRLPILQRLLGKANLSERFITEYFRKIAHFGEFAVLGALVQVFFCAIHRLSAHNMLHGVSLGLFVAVADESLQTLRDRGPMVQDIIIDFCGVLTGCLVVWALSGLFWLLFGRARKQYKV